MVRKITALGILVVGIGLCEAVSQDNDSSTSIIQRSPFVPSNFDPSSQGVTTNLTQDSFAGYEFRGVYQIGDRYWFLVSEPKSRDGSWIELGQDSQDLVARRYDPQRGSLTVFNQNTEHTLELEQLEANPVPIPVQGLVKTTSRTPTKTPTPVRRTIRPTTGSASSVKPPQTKSNTTPPPAWLEKLRTEAAERRARAGQGQGQRGDNNQNVQGADPRRRVITPNRPSSQSQGQKSSKDKSRSR